MATSRSFLAALDNIQSDRLKDRDKGLNDLRQVLALNRRDPGLRKSIKDKSIHSTCEKLFHAVSVERSNYVRAKASNVKSISATRLSTCAEAISLMVEIFVLQMKGSTVSAIVGHILQTLPTADGGFCAPLTFNFFKTLGIVLGHSPHVEHLSGEDWSNIVQFCIDALRIMLEELEAAPPKTSAAAECAQNAGQLVACLRSLAVASNAPILKHAHDIVQGVVEFINASASITQAHTSAFEAINACLKVFSTHSRQLMIKTLLEVLPYIKNLWPRRELSLREEMLVTLIYGKAHIMSTQTSDEIESFHSILDSLFDCMAAEYFAPRDRGHLELGQLELFVEDVPPTQTMPMQGSSMSVRRSTKEAEHNWTMLHFLALFIILVDSKEISRGQNIRNEEERSAKRLKSSSKLTDLINSTKAAQSTNELVYRIQVICFLLDSSRLDQAARQNLVVFLSNYVTHKDAIVASWAMLGLANASLLPHADVQSPDPEFWTNIWHLVARLVPSIHHCRAACHLLACLLKGDKVEYETLTESVESLMTSSSLNGPALFCDSGISLWRQMCLRKLSHSPANMLTVGYDTMVEWISRTWRPSALEERSHLSQLARDVASRDIVSAFQLILGKPLYRDQDNTRLTNLGYLGQAWMFRLTNRSLLEYLLLAEDDDPRLNSQQQQFIRDPSSHGSTQAMTKLSSTVLSLFITEAEQMRKVWQDIKENRSSTINDDVISSIMSFYAAACLVSNILISVDLERAGNLRKLIEISAKDVIFFVSSLESGTRALQVLYSISPFLPNLSGITKQQELLDIAMSLSAIVEPIAKSLHSSTKDANGGKHDYEDEGMDDDLLLEHSSGSSEAPLSSRTQPAASCDEASFRASVALYAQLLLCVMEDMQVDGEATTDNIPPGFIQVVLSLTPSEFTASRPLLNSLFNSGLGFHVQDATDLLEYLETLLKPYEWNRCEVVLASCLDVMIATLNFWTNQDCGTAAEFGTGLYTYFMETALSSGMLSTISKLRLSDLLDHLLAANPEYNHSDSTPSVRTRLFELLRKGNVVVQYHMSQKMVHVFDSFTLSQHELILNDILENLPNDLQHLEGLFVRIHIFAQIGMTWKNLLRLCVYYILETAGMVPEITFHAKRCIDSIAKNLSLPLASYVFELFSPQLLHTWLDTQATSQLPFSIFGYSDLRTMLQDTKGQFLSQLLMIGSDSKMKEFESLIGQSLNEVLSESFGQAAAYGIAKDMSMNSPDGTHSHATETRIRELIGKGRYSWYLKRNLPHIIGHLFLRLNQEQQIERVLDKRTDYEYAAKILRTIKDISSLETPLSQSQQPSFRSKLLLDEIERVCRRIEQNPLEIWTPSVVVQVARVLFNDAKDAFGPLHACRTIQRLRLLVCLAGSAATAKYPLEMLLHGLRPFVTNKHCADDAIGLFQYLLESGKDYLVQSPQFLNGTCLSLLLSLRPFLHSTQDSTTQEAKHRATISKAKEFHSWLSQFVLSMERSVSNPRNVEAFRKMFTSVSQAATVDTSEAGAKASEVVICILEDMKRDEKLLEEKFALSCLNLLYQNFTSPETFLDDELREDERVAALAFEIFKSLKLTKPSDEYIHWAARSLGRAFGHRGAVDPDILRETSILEMKRLRKGMNRIKYGSASKLSIVRLIADVLWDDRSVVVGVAEQALAQIVVSYTGSEEDSIIQNALRPALSESFQSYESAPPSPHSQLRPTTAENISKLDRPFDLWIRDAVRSIAGSTHKEPILLAISELLQTVPDLAEKLFPYMLHLHILGLVSDHTSERETLSEAFNYCFNIADEQNLRHLGVLLNSVLYLRSQPFPQERTLLDRNEWLFLDFEQMAVAAQQRNMFKTALLVIEIGQSMNHRSYQRKLTETRLPRNEAHRSLLLQLFRQVDEPDAFYGVEQDPGLDFIAERLEYEGNNIKSLFLRGAKMDCLLRNGTSDEGATSSSIITSLSKLNLNSITSSFALSENIFERQGAVLDSMIKSAMKLRQWDVALPTSSNSYEGVVYHALQGIHSSMDMKSAQVPPRKALIKVVRDLQLSGWSNSNLTSSFRAMSALTEASDILASEGKDQIFDTWSRLKIRDSWMTNTSLENASPLLTSREAICSIVNQNMGLQDSLKLSAYNSRLFEVNVGLHSSETFRKLGALQESLSGATYLSSLIQTSSTNLNMKFDASVKRDISETLWEQGELVASIQTLQAIDKTSDWEGQAVPVGRAGLLADIAHRVSHARLQKPEDVLSSYLRQALIHLGSTRHGLEAGKVFNEYATYCHAQLENPETNSELRRVERFKRQRTGELGDLKRAVMDAKNEREKVAARRELENVKRWLKIDEEEHTRLKQEREHFIESSLEHYLRSLAACDDFDTNVIRFLAIWFAHADHVNANKIVRQMLPRVPSKKMAPLMNQLGSRLQDSDSEFQSILSEIVVRICQDHPYHGMYHIFAGSETTGGNDSQARSRKNAAGTVAKKLDKNRKTSEKWSAVYKSNELYNRMAKLRDERKGSESKTFKQGAELTMKQFQPSKAVYNQIPTLKIPPITMSVDIRDDLNYNDVPIVTGFKPEITIPSGVSAPKIVTAVGSDGKRYKQLFKSGIDDLRQDAIMEQVFEQVTALLKNDKATRRRNLKIRTYKVVPLDATSGAIEFVEPTMSLNDYLVDAHQRYHPKDLKWRQCRDKLSDASDHSLPTRVKEFRTIKSQFHPVLRHFFLERFEDPDEWFERRLSYTRSTAAISILGHVLGLGDRHCQNILLDTNTGEVVHIDLGVAFEAGRILPKPETIPFRLTRDVVDGFGVLKTEGVFRRCCEFTLEALRQNKDSILTLLNVLRYDPLYNWSVSPLRAKRLQDEQESRMAEAKAGSFAPSRGVSTRNSAAAQEGVNEEANLLKEKLTVEEGGEADRALSTVEKKLATTLSVSAAVNELIQQATDDKNLAQLFPGWAPWA